MEFPIVDLLDDELSESWLLRYFHPDGLKCPRCGRGTEEARHFRQNRRNKVTVYRCRHCQSVYTVYSGTIFQGKHLRPAQVILLLRGICKGEPSAVLARELGISRTTVHTLRVAIQKNAVLLQPDTPLEDAQTETDEMFQNAGEKGRNMPTRRIPLAVGPTNGVGMELMTTIARPSWGRLVGKAERFGCGW
ncbi:MAG: transposase [Anaerolineae bacterium]|jgi:transposase-like protein